MPESKSLCICRDELVTKVTFKTNVPTFEVVLDLIKPAMAKREIVSIITSAYDCMVAIDNNLLGILMYLIVKDQFNNLFL